MLYSTSLVLYTIFSFQLGRKPRVFLALGLAFLLSGLSWAHNFLGESSLHKMVFGSFIVCVFFRTQFLMRTKVTDQLALQKMRKLATVGSVAFVSGYALWLVDEIGCSQLRNARAYTGMPLGFFLELHGWYVSFTPQKNSMLIFLRANHRWHLLTGVGVYCFLVFVEYLHVHINSRQDEYHYSEGTGIFMFPRVFRVKSSLKGKVQ